MTDVNTIKSSVLDEASCTASSHDERRRVITTPPVPINTTLSGLTIKKIVETGKKCNESRDSFPAAGIISTFGAQCGAAQRKRQQVEFIESEVEDVELDSDDTVINDTKYTNNDDRRRLE